MTRVSKEPLVSVIVPIYNCEEYLNKCVESIVNQTYKNLEIILVDDGSIDNSLKMCTEWSKKDKRIKVIHKKNGGVSSARNVGIDSATGKYISFVDSDDWIDPNYYKKMIEIVLNQKADIVQCSYNRILKTAKEKISLKKGIYNNEEMLIMALNPQTGIGFCHMKLYNKKVVDGILFDESLLVGEDALFNENIASKKLKLIVIDEALYNYRINQQSTTKRYDKNYIKKYEQSMKKSKEYILSMYDNKSIIQALYNYIEFHTLLIAVNYCCNSQNKNQLQSIKEMTKIQIFNEAIKKGNYENLSLTRKICLFTIKHKLYLITKLICNIRQNQNRR